VPPNPGHPPWHSTLVTHQKSETTLILQSKHGSSTTACHPTPATRRVPATQTRRFEAKTGEVIEYPADAKL